MESISKSNDRLGFCYFIHFLTPTSAWWQLRHWVWPFDCLVSARTGRVFLFLSIFHPAISLLLLPLCNWPLLHSVCGLCSQSDRMPPVGVKSWVRWTWWWLLHTIKKEVEKDGYFIIEARFLGVWMINQSLTVSWQFLSEADQDGSF